MNSLTNNFVPGQRWISDADAQIGLGTVMSVDFRTVTVVFHAAGETRTYAKQTAPLTRVVFTPGDRVRSHEGWSLKIDTVEENNGLITYIGTKDGGEKTELQEGELDNFIQLNRPTERLFAGQIDPDKWFELRYQTLQNINQLAHSDLRGLTGARTSLIPHQLYIAHEVGNRYAPRVLLADEVGLGKTIEAGLILHHQLLTERARRALIVVPESLVHQWLVEMLRRFNLHFSIFNEERCFIDEETASQVNPFLDEQLAICSLSFLTRNPDHFQHALKGAWDLLVVDEAHHLLWSPEQPSQEYTLVEQLAAVTQGVLLLTATPEQLGKASHFARLRLLDPDRFSDYDAFIEEEQRYEPIAQAVGALLNNQPLNEAAYQTLLNTLQEGDNQNLINTIQSSATTAQENIAARQELVEHLLDRHGTGRILFRNTRAAVKGFPDRIVIAYPLPFPESYAEKIADLQTGGIPDPHQLLCPELLYGSTTEGTLTHWTKIDARIDWLCEKLDQLKSDKVLLITAQRTTALDIAQALRTKAGIHAAVFHEQMSIVERDRAAAFFADQENGSQVMVCSEIGSEGRNFQFAHHLILFDLPLNPDLLEQRIGRLDRIGQTQGIQIHVPYFENSPQAILFHWYHEGLAAFEKTCPVGHDVFVQVKSSLVDALHQSDEGLEDLPSLIRTTRHLYETLIETMQRGRDRLLEYNSCRPQVANTLKERALEQDRHSTLPDYLDAVFDCFGVDVEEHNEHSLILHPNEYMQTSFPGLPDDGLTITYDRNTALSHEDLQYLSREHPMVIGAMDMVQSGELGNTALTAVKTGKLKPGTLLLECLFVLQSASSDAIQSNRFLPPTTIRTIVDRNGKNHAKTIPHELITQTRSLVDTETAGKIIQSQRQTLKELIAQSEQLAKTLAPEILANAHLATEQTLMREINRLKALRHVNPNVRDEEIEYFEKQMTTLTHVVDSTTPRLDALRVIVTT